MKRLLTILALVATLLSVCGCSADRGFKITSCSVASLQPSGLKAVKAVLKVGIINPISRLTISKVSGVINNKGEEFATFSAGKLPILKQKTEKIYPLTCSGAIAKNVGLMDLLKLAASKDFDDMTVNMDVRVRLRCGIGKTFHFKDIKVTDLMEPDVASSYVELLIDQNII